MKRVFLFLLAAAAFVGLASSANAVILGFDENGPRDWNLAGATELTLAPTVPTGNQVENIPCIICGKNQPQQPGGFGYNLFGNTGNESNVSFFSTAIVPPNGSGSGLAIDQIGTGYNVGDGSIFKLALLGRTDFTIGIDVNDSGPDGVQTLELFWFLNLTQHTVLAAWSPGPGGQLIPATNDGTGYPDWTISGFDLDRGDIAAGDQIIFFARISGATDGPDLFFVNPSVAVPGPIVGAGLPGLIIGCGILLGLARRRQRHAV